MFVFFLSEVILHPHYWLRLAAINVWLVSLPHNLSSFQGKLISLPMHTYGNAKQENYF